MTKMINLVMKITLAITFIAAWGLVAAFEIGAFMVITNNSLVGWVVALTTSLLIGVFMLLAYREEAIAIDNN